MAYEDRHQPTWLPEPCPPWCARVHDETDHPEDRVHRDDGHIVQVVEGRVDPHDMRLVPHGVELCLSLSAHVEEDRAWLHVDELEGRPRLVISAESARRLAAALQESVSAL